jgi:integrase
MPRRSRRGQGTIYQETDPKRSTRYRGQRWVTLPDGQHARVTARGMTEKDVLAKLDRAERRLKDAHPDADRMTLAHFVERWLEHKRPQVQPSTYYAYQQALRGHLLPALGEARLARVTAASLQAVVDRVSVTAGPAAADRVRRYALQALEQAKRWGLLARNPAEGVERVRRPGTKRVAWTVEQATAFLRAASASPYYPLFYTAITTGLRQGELLALRWGDVLADHLVVRRTYSQRAPGKVQEPKSGSSHRRVPLSPEGVAVLGRRGAAEALVFPSRGGGMVNHGNLVRAFHRCRERAGLPAARFHDLRRTYASILASAGHHPSVIQRLLGHRTPDLALRVYTDVTDERAALAVVTLSGGCSGGLADAHDGTRGDNAVPRVEGPARDPRPN